LATPFPQRDSHYWKENLANDLLRDAHAKYDNIINTVGFVCRDLEQRCITIESPLRKAEQEINELSERLQIVTEEKLHLEESCAALGQELAGVKIQKEDLSHELRCARAEVESCQEELRNVAAEKEESLMGFEKERLNWKERDEELLMTNHVLDDELKEVQAKLRDLDEKVILLLCWLISAYSSRD
jgi:chromosome segregation ATPase